MDLSQVQKIPNFAYQIYQTLQIYWVYENDNIKYKYDRKWKTENRAKKHRLQMWGWLKNYYRKSLFYQFCLFYQQYRIQKKPTTRVYIHWNPQVQKIPSISYQIYQTLQIYWVYEMDYIKYKYDRKWKTENMQKNTIFKSKMLKVLCPC